MKPSKLLVIQVDSDGTTFYHCKYCDYRSKNHTNAKVHQRIHFNHRPHVCDSCQYASNSASNLKKHLLQHTDVTFTCAHCPYSSKSKQYLKKHMKSHTATVTSPLFGSPDTARMAITDNNCTVIKTNNHNSGHPVVELFWCALCHVYEVPPNVEGHLRSTRHTSMLSKFPHRCAHCEAGFFESTSLEIHTQLAHLADSARKSLAPGSLASSKPLHCARCSYSTASSILLEAHRSVAHDGSPSFLCGWCGQEFLLEASQREHVLQRLLLQTIEKRARLVCSFCLKTFQHKDVVRKHEAEEHSEISSADRIRCCVCRRIFRTKKSHREHFCRKRNLEEPPLLCTAQTVAASGR
ncbi:zinc finger protein-like [Tropilaelaps mercedesae]|uniref:Zinc finger protein-like n=1 Tax=Tropilaelaps mercedesae TaxID=418985 RepID=A0A1V9X7A8_9ACAR|nr:zinc finger protein-like [Tropilaelaps mercedesae]